MILLAILILSFPMDFELYRERKGEDPKTKGRSMSVRAMLMIICAGVATGIITPKIYPWVTSVHLWPLTITYLKCLFLSFAIFFLFFDYAINLILGRKPWYSYLSKSPLDKLWSKWDWRVRMAIRITVFTTSLIIFLWN